MRANAWYISWFSASLAISVSRFTVFWSRAASGEAVSITCGRTRSNDQGRYRFDGVPRGEIRLGAQTFRDGRDREEVTLWIDGDLVVHDVELAPKPPDR